MLVHGDLLERADLFGRAIANLVETKATAEKVSLLCRDALSIGKSLSLPTKRFAVGHGSCGFLCAGQFQALLREVQVQLLDDQNRLLQQDTEVTLRGRCGGIYAANLVALSLALVEVLL